jgi:hypothetical protein
MPTPALEEDVFYLNTIVVQDHAPQSRTDTLSHAKLDSLLTEHVAAITLGARTTLRTHWLWDAMVDKPQLFDPLLKAPRRANRWMLFCKSYLHGSFEFKTFVEHIDRYANKPQELLLLGCPHHGAFDLDYVVTLVPAAHWKQSDADQIRKYLDTAFTYHSHVALKRAARANDEESSDREAQIRVRREMLTQVGSYSSEDLAAAASSTTSNASQFAADQRGLGKFFGVRFGQAWHYPKFQFDAKRQAIPEMKQVLAALSPDEQGWDRLQWFLEPHEKLKGLTPLEIWKTDRKKVIEAANAERWNGRD